MRCIYYYFGNVFRTSLRRPGWYTDSCCNEDTKTRSSIKLRCNIPLSKHNFAPRNDIETIFQHASVYNTFRCKLEAMQRIVGTFLGNAAKGAAIGAANTVPGVSGGTIAVVTGIYDRLVHAIGDFLSPRWRQHTLFLTPIVVGVFLGIAGFAWVIDVGLNRFPEQTFFFFVGLIAGSVPFVYKQVHNEKPRIGDIALALVAFGFLVFQGVYGEPPMSDAITVVESSTIVPLLVAGVLATGTMIIPGVSGSFVLLVIGMYSTFLQAVRTANIPVLGVLIVGAVIGLVAVSKVMSVLLDRFRRRTYWFILGLVAGSIVGIWPGVTSVVSGVFDLVAAVVGAGLALLLGKSDSVGEIPDAQE
jgi:putative membrane protein